MKKIILYTLFSCCLFQVFAKNNSLKSPISLNDSTALDSLTVPDSITYTPGNQVVITRDTFTFETGESTGSQLKTTESNQTLNLSEGAGSQSLTTAQLDAGRTTGVIDVSPTGAATYTIPIALPPGISGVMPQVSLSYNSQGGNGVAGFGWNIGGLSAITRIPSTRFHDNKIGGINFDQDDRFAFDGQRLILKSGTYGGDGAEYQTENFSNVKIVSKGVSSYGANFGPAYFEVYYPDGSKAFYGNSVDSRSQICYALTYSENPLGARVSYHYLNSNNLQFISQITYGALGTATPLNEINFVYGAPVRKEQTFVGGVNFYSDKLLTEINVVANGTDYRHYTLTHDVISTLNYQRLVNVVEESGDRTKSFAPINFSYDNQPSSISYLGIQKFDLSGINQTNCKILTEDFKGDGKLGFIISPNNPNSTLKDKVYLLLSPDYVINGTQFGTEVPTGVYEDIFSVKQLYSNNKQFERTGFVLIKPNGTTSIKFQTYVTGTPSSSAILAQYEKIWNNVPANGYNSQCTDEGYVIEGRIPRKYLSGDFNGDGLTDIVSITKPYQQYYEYYDQDCLPANQISVNSSENEVNIAPGGPQPIGCCVRSTYPVSSATVTFINLDRRLSSDFVTNSGGLEAEIGEDDQLITADFNGDGKTDILHITSGKMYAYGFNQNGVLYKLWETTVDGGIKSTHNIKPLMGDFNGDGKADVIFPTGVAIYNYFNFTQPGSQPYSVFLSTGKGFQKTVRNLPFGNVEVTYNGNGELKAVEYISVDLNGDNRSDIVRITTHTNQNQPQQGQLQISTFNNMGGENDLNLPMFEKGPFKNYFTTNLIHYPVPVFTIGDKPNYNLEFGLMSNSGLHSFKLSKDLGKEALVKDIVQDGITESISYKPLINVYDQNDDLQLYKEEYDQIFPFVNIHSAMGLKVVNKLTRIFNGNSISQAFGYQGGVSNTEGLGFLGFRRIIRSSWFTPTEQNRIYNINITDPKLRGAVTKSFTSKYPYTSSSAEAVAAIPSDLTKNDPSTTTETLEASRSVTLTNGFTANGSNGTFIAKINNPATGVNDGASINNYITRIDYTYQSSLSASKVFTNVPTSVMTKDLLNGTNTTVNYTYDNYLNVTKQESNYSGAGTSTTDITYENNTSSNYYIGRPLTKKTTLTNANDVFSTEEEYTYTGYSPTQVKKKGNGTPFIIENIQYDVFGNVTRKGTTAGGVERFTTKQYDATGRFVLKSTDLEGLESNFTYDTSTGNILTTTNPYGFVNTLEYDSWGRLTRSTDFLGKYTQTFYVSTGVGEVDIVEIGEDGSSSSTKSNALGLEIENASKNVLGQYTIKKMLYDEYGRLLKSSEPEQSFSFNQWNEITYDEYSRPKKHTSYTGKITNITYNGLSVTVNDGTKSITTTKNALGNVVSTQDPGGTISYTYYANGNLKSSTFDGSTQSIVQDGWGRKTQLTDPSAGIYTYEYNAFGETTKETTPKGSTSYTFNAIGKLQSKVITGDDTNLSYQYTYDGTTKLLNSLALTNSDGNNTNYTYTYDSYKRLQSTVEDNSQAKFTKTFAFDDFGRISTETSTALNKSNSKTVSKTVLNTYQNGALKSIADNGTGEIIWQVTAVNARGQVTAANLASGNMKQSNTYDQYGFAQELKTQRLINTPAVLMTLGYSFNAQRGILDSRSNSVFNWNETFTHDSQDRLTSFNDNNSSQSHIYDNKGRISTNSYLGNYVYNGASYQQTGLNNATIDAKRHYQDRTLQEISYNAFKSPVEISESGVEKISFQYNGGLGRAHRYYGSDATDKMTRPFRKHYSEDGSMEITEDLVNGTTSFVFYMGGDAYSAPAIWKEVHSSGSTSQAMYYLHRDHLGSINLITDNQGVIKEQRQFDAWGNIVKLTDGNGNVLADFVILDRGYTGHEHLLAVGLIHMNGRLYDPLLHRFLQPDNYVQDPTNTQNYNRYGYVLNNPLSHVDPSGEIIWMAVGIMAAVGAISGGAAYVGSAIRTGNWSWGQFGLSVLGGAAIGAITGGINPMAIFSVGSIGGVAATGFASGLLPSISGQIGDFSFSISPAIAFGQSFGVGANLSVGYSKGNLSISAGLGYMAYGNYQGFGKSGSEIRQSIMAAYDDGNTGFSLGSNFWSGSTDMSEFSQKTGVVGIRSGGFRFSYENDGMPFNKVKLGDGNDSYRTAAATIGIGDFSVGFNLFTGRRTDYSGDAEKVGKSCLGTFGERMPNNLVNEDSRYQRYRFGGLSLRYGNYRVGINSDRYVRHPIQDMFAHNLKFPLNTQQPGFESLSNSINPYFQYQSINPFTSW